ncbi:FAD-dependent oxidoreductase [Bacillus sp. B15-48]|uniref:oxidoreductase n=1 Tax=Bacillus sp. B15-48 TaxID=1548601 RepID=UPI00193FEBA9|nr:FAD-dependent oxidoreductase [Bacillus sp. B15-48]MBM4763372.1 NAD(P)-binding protein [Bacillus sp. B15-48]
MEYQQNKQSTIESNYAKLLEPAYIGKMKLKNRMILSPMGTFLDHSDGSISKAQLDYYEARAKGGVGMVTVEAQYITNKTDPWLKNKTVVDTDKQLEDWKKLADCIHKYDAKISLELSIGLGRNSFGFEDGDMVSASAISAGRVPNVICRPLTVSEIKDLVACYGRAARRALQAGVDCLLIHAHAGYLQDQFLTPIWNKRTDEYGGSFQNRMRFITETYKAIRNEVGPNFPIAVRLGAYHDFPGGRTLEEGIEIIKYLEGVGVDAFDIDIGCLDRKQWITPTIYHGLSSMAHAAAAVKKEVSVPVINAGTHSPESAEELLKEGLIDFVQFGRPLIADPELPVKLYNNQPDAIRPCIFCNEFCIGNTQKGKAISCAVQPQINYETHFPEEAAKGIYPDVKVDTPKKVVVIGGGPGGMEAARAAASRGHEVTLYDKNNTLGGHLVVASKLSFKGRLNKFITWQERELRQLGVKIELGRSINENSPELASADQIIVALGQQQITPEIKGIEQNHVIDVIQAYNQPELIKGDNIVITGANIDGCDLALELVMRGKDVTIVEKDDELIREALADNRDPLMFKFEDYHVNVLTSRKVVEFTATGVKVRDSSGEIHEIQADTIVTAFGRTAESQLTKRICEKYKTVIPLVIDHPISVTGRAVHAGFKAALSI